MGPGIVLKALLQGSFSLMVFGWAQILMDIQPLLALLTQQGQLHGFSHTYAGALLIALIAALSGKGLSEWGLLWLGISRTEPIVITWRVAGLSALIGTATHVLLDSLMHADMTPWYPIDLSNNLLGLISIELLHRLCLGSAVVGALLYLSIRWWLSRQGKNGVSWR